MITPFNHITSSYRLRLQTLMTLNLQAMILSMENTNGTGLVVVVDAFYSIFKLLTQFIHVAAILFTHYVLCM